MLWSDGFLYLQEKELWNKVLGLYDIACDQQKWLYWFVKRISGGLLKILWNKR